MVSKFFTVILINCLGSRKEWFKLLNNSGPELIRPLAIHVTHHIIGAFSFNKYHDDILMRSSNNSVAFPVTNVGASLNRFISKSNRAPIKDLTASIMATR